MFYLKMLTVENIPILIAASFLLWVLIKNLNEDQIKEKKRIQAGFILYFMIFEAALPFLMIISVFLWMYRYVINLLLKLRLGNSYYQLVKGMDILFSIFKWDFSFIQILMVFECDSRTTGDNIHQMIKKFLLQYQAQYQNDTQKLYCTLEEWMGCLYYKKVQVTADDYVLKLPVNHFVKELDRADLTRLLSEVFYDKLPLNNTMLWDVHIGTQSLKCEKPGKTQYPVLFRYHHTIGDGIALIRLLLNVLGETNVECFESHSSFTKSLKKKGSWLNTIRVTFDVFTMMPSLTYISWFLKKGDVNDTFFESTKREILSYGSDENGKYLKKVKAIKMRCPEISFSDIVLTAVSATIHECFKKYKKTSPSQIMCFVPYIADYQNFLGCSQKNGKGVSLSNQCLILQLETPIFIDNHKDYVKRYPLTSRLKILNHLFKNLKTPTEFMFKGIVFPNCDVLPSPILRLLLSYFDITLVLSVLPGPSRVIFDKVVVSECTFWAPHAKDLGPNFSILTYDSQLRVGVNYNGSSELTEEDVSEMINNIYHNIDLLEQEISDQHKEH